MKFQLLLVSFLLYAVTSLAQQSYTQYEVSSENPYGLLNPNAPQAVADYAPLIGTCDCLSETRNADQTWAASQQMTWTFKYIMNGTAVQDETLKEDGSHSGSIRQFIADSSKWYVHYYSSASPTVTLPVWEGTKRGDSIVLYREQKAPNGMDGFFRLTFSDISSEGFEWEGAWTDPKEQVVFPTWRIYCKKRNTTAVSAETEIRANSRRFSKAYEEGDYQTMTELYTEDAYIFPPNSGIISGAVDILKKWTLPKDTRILSHKATPTDIVVHGDFAYDFGTYEGISEDEKGRYQWKGKYVIVWKFTGTSWKMYLDIWNRI